MNVNATAAIDAATNSLVAAAKPDTTTLLDWMLELEQTLRIARLRVVIEGEDVIPDVYETLAGLAAAVRQKLT